ncbi:DUF547 domain-containing protein [Cyclobacteriaceae bacterium]|nr:DUF547 domain-containing protein [Cyclobacteriaceae bacterium]
MKRLFIIPLLALLFSSSFVSSNRHSEFDILLRTHVTPSGAVNYVGFKKQHSSLKKYINSLEQNPVQTTENKDIQLAYWINLYNAVTLNLILDHYPIESITKIKDAWKLNMVTINGKAMSLDHIEKNIIIPRFKDARIHFAVNCAAKSCPKLLNEAFKGAKLQSQLNSQTKAFINNSAFNQITSNKLKLSQIFNWYKTDFGNSITFINKYSSVKVNPTAQISYMEYDWALNKK